MKGTLTDLEFLVYYKENSKVSDIDIEVKANGTLTSDYAYESISLYKIDSTIDSVCELNRKTQKLNDDYILKDDEQYAIDIEEININGMDNSISEQSLNHVFVNGDTLDSLSQYCTGTKYENGSSRSYQFVLPSSAKLPADESEIMQSEEIQSKEIVATNDNNTNIQSQNFYLPISICIISLLLIIIAVLLYKNSKNKKHDY